MSTQHGFWIAATDNRVFDGIVTRHLIAHGDIIAINAFFQSASYSFSDIVQQAEGRFRQPSAFFSTHGQVESPWAGTPSVRLRLWTGWRVTLVSG